MKIYVDADACPKAIKAVLFRAAERTQTLLIVVANQLLTVPKSRFIQAVQVAQGLDVADAYIAEQVVVGDLVITADIPLADQVVGKGAVALDPRGKLYTHDNIKQRLGMRNFMDSLRSSGVQTGGPKSLHPRDVQQFANALDRCLAGA